MKIMVFKPPGFLRGILLKLFGTSKKGNEQN